MIYCRLVTQPTCPISLSFLSLPLYPCVSSPSFSPRQMRTQSCFVFLLLLILSMSPTSVRGGKLHSHKIFLMARTLCPALFPQINKAWALSFRLFSNQNNFMLDFHKPEAFIYTWTFVYRGQSCEETGFSCHEQANFKLFRKPSSLEVWSALWNFASKNTFIFLMLLSQFFFVTHKEAGCWIVSRAQESQILCRTRVMVDQRCVCETEIWKALSWGDATSKRLAHGPNPSP